MKTKWGATIPTTPRADEGKIVDCYAHVSRRKYQPVERLVEEMDRAGIDAAVLVQPLDDLDNGHLFEALTLYAGRFKAVGMVDTHSADGPRRISELVERGGLSGIRATAGFLAEWGSVGALADANGVLLTHLPQGISPHLKKLVSIAERFPSLRIFVPHLGWPEVNRAPALRWKETLSTLSSYPQISVGISGLHYYSETPPPHEDTWSLIDSVLKQFGPERCMCGSDFPLLLETDRYQDYFAPLCSQAFGMDLSARNMVLGGAAIKFWGFGRKRGPEESYSASVET
ncbi:MAG: amidohydrolase [Acidobacteriia bacterium]|nr:amidohydrolase [Terriglobia bacterium]